MDSTADEITLDVDREIEALLDGALPNTDDPREDVFARWSALDRWFGIDPERALLGAGRRLLRLQRQIADLVASENAIRAEYERARSRLVEQAVMLESAVESVALARREEGRGNSLVLPGIGTWETRKVPGRWSVADPEAVAAALTGSERESYMKPQPDKLDARALLADIADVLTAHGGEVLPGLQKSEDRVSVSAKYDNGGAK